MAGYGATSPPADAPATAGCAPEADLRAGPMIDQESQEIINGLHPTALLISASSRIGAAWMDA